jgi:heterodisulfide reductase subunit C
LTIINQNLLPEIKKYSTKELNVDACFNCGNCTAVCPISDEDHQFPRYLLRYAQVGLKSKLLSNHLMWVCAYCDDCSDTCPRDAEPGEFVMATRRWAMGQYEVTGIGRFINTHRWAGLGTMATIFFFSLFLFGLFSTGNITSERPIRLFDLIGKEVVEVVGILTAAVLLGIIGLSILNEYFIISKQYNSNIEKGIGKAFETRKKDKKLNSSYHLLFSPIIMVKQAIIVIFKEVLMQYSQLKCALAPHNEDTRNEFIRNRYFGHMMILWGIFGLGIATLANMFLKPDSNSYVDILFPVRFLGITSGLLLMVGVSIAAYNRLRKSSRYSSHTMICDWVFLLNLFMVGFTGFLITSTYYVTSIPVEWAYWFFVIHVIFVIELVLLAPFGKMAHVWFRSFALWIHYGLNARKNKLKLELKKEKARIKAEKKKVKAAKSA